MSQPRPADLVPSNFDDVAHAVLGMATRGRSEAVGTVGRLYRSLRNKEFIKQLGNEWSALKQEGKMAAEYTNSGQHQACLQEMLDSLDDDDANDGTRFGFLKAIFLAVCCEKLHDRNSILPQQLMKLARSLSSTDIVVLAAEYRRAQEIESTQNVLTSYYDWIKAVMKRGDVPLEELIHLVDQRLVDKQLFSPRHHADNSGVNLTRGTRLTVLGRMLCDYSFYDEG